MARDRLPLVSWLVASTAEGLAAGLASGFILLFLHADIQLLMAGQPSPLLAIGVFLVQCCQIGVLVSICATLMLDWSS
jgi:hypothetical protein